MDIAIFRMRSPRHDNNDPTIEQLMRSRTGSRWAVLLNLTAIVKLKGLELRDQI